MNDSVKVEVFGHVCFEPLEVFIDGQSLNFMESINPELYFLIEKISNYLWKEGGDYIKVSFDIPKDNIRDYSKEYAIIEKKIFGPKTDNPL